MAPALIVFTVLVVGTNLGLAMFLDPSRSGYLCMEAAGLSLGIGLARPTPQGGSISRLVVLAALGRGLGRLLAGAEHTQVMAAGMGGGFLAILFLLTDLVTFRHPTMRRLYDFVLVLALGQALYYLAVPWLLGLEMTRPSLAHSVFAEALAGTSVALTAFLAAPAHPGPRAPRAGKASLEGVELGAGAGGISGLGGPGAASQEPDLRPQGAGPGEAQGGP